MFMFPLKNLARKGLRYGHARWYLGDYQFWARSGYQGIVYHFPDFSDRFRDRLHRDIIDRTLYDDDVISFTRQML